VRTGNGGSGKTRLAFEICEELQDRAWQAGFVNGEQFKNLVRDAGARWGWDRPTLAVVDYAAERADVLHSWLAQLANFAPVNAPPLRILLLERQADVRSGWLQTVLGVGDAEARTLRTMLDPAAPLPLSGLVAPEHRRAVLDGMFAKLDSPIRTPAAGADPEFDRRLAELTWGGEPLFLMMAASLAAERSLPQVLALPRTDIAHRMAEREVGSVRRLARERGLDPDLLLHMTAYVTLCQGISRDKLLAAIEIEAAEMGRGLPGGAAILADAMAEALPGTPAMPEPIRPDALGEALVLEVLSDTRINGAAVVRRAFAQVGQGVAATVIRTAQDFADAGNQQPLEWLSALGGSVDLDQLMLVADQLPDRSLALLSVSARIMSTIVGSLRHELKAGKDYRRRGLAVHSSHLAVRLGALGYKEAAVDHAQLASTLLRELATRAPDVYGPDLASVLTNLALCLSDVGQRREAFVPANEAVDLYRELAARAPDAYRPALAAALNNLALCRGGVGKHQEAIAQAKEAVDLYRELGDRAPDAYRPDLASALNSLAICMSEFGQRQEALAPAKEAVDLHRELAARAPDAYRPGFAVTLNTLALCLSDVGQRREALARAQEAVDLYCELGDRAPDAYRPDFAMALATLALCLSQVGQRQEALARAKEAVDLHRKLAAQAPDAYRPALAMTLDTLALCLSDVGQRQEALAPAQEAVQMLAPHFLSLPQAYAQWMATMVHNYRKHCQDLGHEPEVELLGPIAATFQRLQEEQGDAVD
jgi:tetratricopeptide (TPR) repeat protein